MLESNLTDFQKKILACVRKSTNQITDTWTIAQNAFPEHWTKKTGRARSGRAALVGHIQRASRKMGLVIWRSPGIWSVTNIGLSDKWR